MSDIYKIAAQNNMRFPSARGLLTVEYLFQMPLKAASGFDLDTVAITINRELKTMTEESFVAAATSNPRKAQLEVALDIVKDVIKTKEAENAAERKRLDRVVERKKLLDAIGAKKDAAMTATSLEDLEKQLAALD